MQKIFDIIPPGQIKQGIPLELKEKPLFFKKRFLVPLFFLILIGASSFFFIESRAEIEIWPKTKVQSFKTQVTVTSGINEVSPDAIGTDAGLIPGKIIAAERTVSQKFSSSKTVAKETKARGQIRVYNNYSIYSQSLRAQTRFMSDSGKVFITPKEIIVPGKKSENGKWTPGFVDIEVIAVEAGPDYNIGPSTFSIPGLKGTSLYTFFYARSFEPMEEGSRTEVSLVTKEDLKEATEVLTEKALSESKNSLIRELPEDWVLIEELTKSEIIEIFPFAEAGQELESFMVQVKAKSNGLVFKKSDLDYFAKEYITAEINPDQNFHPSSLELKYSLLKQGEGENAELNLNLSAKIYSKIDIENLKRQVLDKDSEQVKRDILRTFSEINEVKVNFWPFWVKKTPLDIKNVKINLNFED